MLFLITILSSRCDLLCVYIFLVAVSSDLLISGIFLYAAQCNQWDATTTEAAAGGDRCRH